MSLLGLSKKTKKDIRDVVYSERDLRKAAKDSIRDQKIVTQKAAKLRKRHAQ